MNYITFLFGAFFTAYPIITMKTYSINGQGYYEVSSVVFIAPIIAISSFINIMFENEIDEFRSKSKKRMIAMFVLNTKMKVRDKIQEGMDQTEEWLNRKNL
jgi:hypothetical protein